MQRSRRFCFTINNPNKIDNSAVTDVNCKFIIAGNEVGASGTPHIQGYIEFNDAKSIDSVRKHLGGRAHVEAAKGTAADNIEYCSKDRNIIRRDGQPIADKQGKRNDLQQVR